MSVEPIRAVLSGRPMSTTHEPLSASDGTIIIDTAQLIPREQPSD
jgi:hypothetical protein